MFTVCVVVVIVEIIKQKSLGHTVNKYSYNLSIVNPPETDFVTLSLFLKALNILTLQ